MRDYVIVLDKIRNGKMSRPVMKRSLFLNNRHKCSVKRAHEVIWQSLIKKTGTRKAKTFKRKQCCAKRRSGYFARENRLKSKFRVSCGNAEQSVSGGGQCNGNLKVVEGNLKVVEGNLNVTVSPTTGETPLEAVYGYQPRFNERGTEKEWRPRAEVQAKQKDYYDRRRHQVERCQVGDIVVMRAAGESTGTPKKLQAKYKGPMVVIGVLPADTYRVRNLRGTGRGNRRTTAHISQLKIYRGYDDEVDLQSSEEDGNTEEDGDIEEEDIIDEEARVDEDGETNDEIVRDEGGEGYASTPGSRAPRHRRAPVRFADYVVNGDH